MAVTVASVWDVIRDPRTAAMRLADEEIDATMPDEPDAIERMRQEVVALTDLWLAERARSVNAPQDSCPACEAFWRPPRPPQETRAATLAVVTPQAPPRPVVLPPPAESLTPPEAAVQAPSESDQLRLAVATVATEVQHMAGGDGAGDGSVDVRRFVAARVHPAEFTAGNPSRVASRRRVTSPG